jgi:hypothetical protein
MIPVPWVIAATRNTRPVEQLIEIDVGDCVDALAAGLAPAQQRHGALDAPGHQVGVRGLPEDRAELAGEVGRGHQRGVGHRGYVERARVLPVDQVTGPAQVLEVLGGHPASIAQGSLPRVHQFDEPGTLAQATRATGSSDLGRLLLGLLLGWFGTT